MAFMQWSDSLSVGVEEIDDQHKKLVSIINKLYDAIQCEKGAEIISEIMSELIEYTNYHFTAEETLMKDNAFPDYESHQLSHINFVEKVMDLELDSKAGNHALSVYVFIFLRDWLVNHIQCDDKKYAPFLTRANA